MPYWLRQNHQLASAVTSAHLPLTHAGSMSAQTAGVGAKQVEQLLCAADAKLDTKLETVSIGRELPQVQAQRLLSCAITQSVLLLHPREPYLSSISARPACQRCMRGNRLR